MLRGPTAPFPALPVMLPRSPSPVSQRALRAGGQPIGELMQQALANPGLFSLAAGFVDDQTLPVEAARAALDKLLSDGSLARQALQYGTTFGYLPLREKILADMLQADGQTRLDAGLDVEQVIVAAGSNQLLHLLADTLFDSGDIVLCAAPSYFVYVGLLRNLGVRSVGVASDDRGLIPEALDETLAALERAGEGPRVKAIYVVSYFDNPRGVTLAAERRPQLVELAQRYSRHGAIRIIDDMAYRELRYAGQDSPSLRSFDETGETVISTHTFSKSFAPGIRVGFGLLPRTLVEPVSNQKNNVDFGSPNLNQYIMDQVLSQGLLQPQIVRARAGYRAKLAAMLQAADRYLGHLPGVSWLSPQGGLYVWLTLPDSVHAGPSGGLFAEAVHQGVLYVPGEYCFPGEPAEALKNTIRLSFGAQTPAEIDKGMAALARALQNILSRG